jgi:hypothetical protein
MDMSPTAPGTKNDQFMQKKTGKSVMSQEFAVAIGG